MIHSRLFCLIRFINVYAFGAAQATTTTCGMQFVWRLRMCVCASNVKVDIWFWAGFQIRGQRENDNRESIRNS